MSQHHHPEFHRTVLPLRNALLTIGTQDGLTWWPGTVLSASNTNVLTALFPATGVTAGHHLLERAVRRIGAGQRAQGVTLFDFTEEYEVVLQQHPDHRGAGNTPEVPAVPTLTSGVDVAAWLKDAFHLPDVAPVKWVLNDQHRHAVVADPWPGETAGEPTFRRLALLVSGLSHSRPGAYFQPVLTAPRDTQVRT